MKEKFDFQGLQLENQTKMIDDLFINLSLTRKKNIPC